MEKSKLKRELKREAGEGDDKLNDRPLAENGSDAEGSPDTKQSKRSPLKKVSIFIGFSASSLSSLRKIDANILCRRNLIRNMTTLTMTLMMKMTQM